MKALRLAICSDSLRMPAGVSFTSLQELRLDNRTGKRCAAWPVALQVGSQLRSLALQDCILPSEGIDLSNLQHLSLAFESYNNVCEVIDHINSWVSTRLEFLKTLQL